MNDKYIIKNCENLLYCTACKEYECAIADDFGYKRRCSDNNNCNLKQIVELCKEDLNSLETYVDVRSLECVTLQNVLQLLDIQEVE